MVTFAQALLGAQVTAANRSELDHAKALDALNSLLGTVKSDTIDAARVRRHAEVRPSASADRILRVVALIKRLQKKADRS